MARRGSATVQEELYSTPDGPAREELEDARLLDLDAEKESPFLRAQKRVSARRSPLPKKTARRLIWVALALVLALVGFVFAAALYHYGEHSWRFRLDSSDNIEMSGLGNVSRSQIMEVMGGDIGRNIFFVPLDQRQKQLEQIPWVESASVMRFAPNRIRIQVHERTPVAFARVGSKVMLIDAGGVLMELTGRKKYSFPVIVGMSPGEPLSSRTARMKTYDELLRELDSSGGHYSQDLSEVDLTDPEDVKVLTNDPEGEVLVHLGSSDYLERFKIYVGHLREWRQQFPKLESVDLRYDRQIIVNPDLQGAARPPVLSASVAKAAIAAGVKPSALISREPRPTAARVLPVRTSATKFSKPVLRERKVALATTKAKPAQWHKHSTPLTKSAATKTVSHTASLVKPQHPIGMRQTALRKPSPAIKKGQENR
ncbi:MAG TPA: FtsQ-type POTRA domain-containing protein [Terriglobales bacterium]|nr:FtsQ-type POTRA domain-containing protein [Terriglobales bacterium]